MVKSMDKFLWEIFTRTGDYRYYLLLKEMENQKEENEDRKSKGDRL